MKMPEEGCRGEILLVDDSPSSLSYLSAMLTQAGYQVRQAPSGELALMTLKIRIAELVLLDVRMPDMDGFEVCRRIKADEVTREIPVIFLSAQDETTDKVLGLKVGAVDFIGKTFAPEEMLARIDTHITLARVKKALERERAGLEDRVSKRTEELRREQALLLSVIDSGPDWICAIDSDRRYLLVNTNMATALGHANAAELIGEHDCEASPRQNCFGSDAPPLYQWHEDEQKIFAGENVFLAKEYIALPDGRCLVFETYKTPLRNPGGDIYGMLCFRRDITRRLKMEEENRALEIALWQAKKMEAVGQLAGGIAHDFNHLLSLILGYTEFARTALANGKTEKLAYYLSEVAKAGTEGQMVVAQLLAFSRTDEPANDRIDVGPVISELAESLRQIAGDQVTIEFGSDTELPFVFMRPVQIKQIVTNLVLNARDALNGKGSITLGIRREHVQRSRTCASCRKHFRGDYLLLTVQDDGPGIPCEIMDKIFDPFFTTKDVGKGAGLGLSMVHGIVHSAGGHVQVESTATTGTEVLLFIPIVSSE